MNTTTISKTPKKKRFPILAILSFIAIFFFAFTIPSFFFSYKYLETEACENPDGILDKILSPNCEENTQKITTVVETELTDVSEVYLEVNNSVVGIGIFKDNGEASDNVIGTGFVVSEDGLIATNQHVVSDTDATYFIKFPNQSEIFEVENIVRDRVNDIAIVDIEAENLKPLSFSTVKLTPGQRVIAIGNPLGELNSTVTSGIISGLNRTVEVGSGSFLRTEVSRFEDTIQTDAAINPGNSGGPLLNMAGEVIGINFSTVSGANNLSFAIPISYLENRLNELQELGRFRIPYVGIEYRLNTYRSNGDVIIGAEVLGLDLQGSAVGVLEDGDIIVRFDGSSLEEDSLLRLIQTSEIGKEVEIEFFRDGELQTGVIEIVERE